MRMYLKRAVQWVLALALLQVAVYYWAVLGRGRHDHKHARNHDNAAPHPSLPSVGDLKEGTCTFETCSKVKDGVLNVHLIPHSHIDVGWLKSVDEYYTGNGDGDFGNTQYGGCVRCIINATLKELLPNPERTFIFAEIKYFSRFWAEATEGERKIIKDLIKDRRLEIVNGGWVMSDAGVTVYNDIIDQHTLGFDFIRETLGPCAQTRTAWHVDQFGHSSEHAAIFSQMGYDSLFIGRISDEDKSRRKSSKSMEMIWLTDAKNMVDKSPLFTHISYDGYYAPRGFVLENLSENALNQTHNVRSLLDILKQRAQAFKTNHLLVPMGSDFGYRNPHLWFNNMDLALKKVRALEKSDVNLIYSTPSCYIHYVNEEIRKRTKAPAIPLPVKIDDFLPYVTDAVWSGFYSTRGGLKRHIWQAGQILQSCKQLAIFSGLEGTFDKVNELRDTVAVMQHHDAITGTQKKAVLSNYNALLSNSTLKCQEVMADVYKSFWGEEIVKQIKSPLFCNGLNMSSCEVTEDSDEFLVTAYNPMVWPVQLPIRFPGDLDTYEIYDKEKQLVPHQVLPVPEGIRSIPERPVESAQREVTFMTTLPPLSVTSFYVKGKESQADKKNLSFEKIEDPKFTIENEHIALTFDRESGLLINMRNKASGASSDVTQDFVQYVPDRTFKSEGAYLFVPGTGKAKSVSRGKPVLIKVIKGDLVEEVHQTFGESITQVVRLYKGSKFAEFHWTVGNLDVSYQSRHTSINIVSLFSSTLSSRSVFYTDSNGRGMMKRMRAPWDSYPEHRTPGNYYPVTSRIFIRDKQKKLQLTVLPDRPQGGSSLVPGAIELMVHRRSLMDDGLGMQEPLNDVGSNGEGIFYTGKHYVYLDTIENSRLAVRRMAWETHIAPTLMFTELKSSENIEKAMEQHIFMNSAALPDPVNLLTLDRITQNDSTLLLIRLENGIEAEHMQDVDEIKNPAVVELESLFKPFDIVSVEETTLGGNFNPKQIHRLQWVSEKASPLTVTEESAIDADSKMVPPFKVDLPSMTIRTFRVKIEKVVKE